MADNKTQLGFSGSGKTQSVKPSTDTIAVTDHSCDVQAATGFVDDRVVFLQKIRTIAEAFDTHIICFNADMLAGKRHAQEALRHAVRSFNNGSMISNTLEMEALLFAAGSRQCSVAASFGIHDGDNSLFVCCYPIRDGVWDALIPLLNIIDQKWDTIDPKKRVNLMKLFEISEEEIATNSSERITHLVLERTALLEVYR